MPDRLRGPPLYLRLNLSFRGGVIDDDPKLIVMDEEAAGRPLPIGVERHSLNREVTNVTTNHNANEAEQTTRDRVHVLGAVLHT